MKKIILNLAMLDLINFCHDNNIPANGYDGEGTHTAKLGRGFTFGLVSAKTRLPIVTVTFYKSQVPIHVIFPKGGQP